jgi:hypothetical protein
MYWVDVKFEMSKKERWEGLTKEQAEDLYAHYNRRNSGAWYVRMGEM